MNLLFVIATPKILRVMGNLLLYYNYIVTKQCARKCLKQNYIVEL